MEFRPCIDIHNGKVKQIVGGSLKDQGDQAKENFVSEMNADDFARMYKKDGLKGGHIILLNPASSEYYNDTKKQALLALKEYPSGMQIGGGINADNGMEFIEAGASHVIVTSYVFKDGIVNYSNLDKLLSSVGKEHLVLDLSCKKKDANSEDYYIVTDRWQNFTDEVINYELLDKLSSYASEFLIHAVDVEGKAQGIEENLVAYLGDWLESRPKLSENFAVTYAGGIKDMSDIEKLKLLGHGKINYTVGSALDLFGGKLKYSELI